MKKPENRQRPLVRTTPEVDFVEVQTGRHEIQEYEKEAARIERETREKELYDLYDFGDFHFGDGIDCDW